MQGFFSDVNWKDVAISVAVVFILLLFLGRRG